MRSSCLLMLSIALAFMVGLAYCFRSVSTKRDQDAIRIQFAGASVDVRRDAHTLAQRPFDADEWRSWDKLHTGARLEMLADLGRRDLVGWPEVGLVSLLGTPGARERRNDAPDEEELRYALDAADGTSKNTDLRLYVRLRAGRVASVKLAYLRYPMPD